MNTKAVFYAAIVAIFCGTCDAITYTDCGSVDGTIVSIAISDCPPSAKRCILKRNTNATMDIEFTPSLASKSLTAVVHGVILGVPAIFPLPNPDGCIDSGVECPIQAGQTYKYTATMPILANYPRITLDIKWELQGDHIKSDEDKGDTKIDIICGLIPVKIA